MKKDQFSHHPISLSNQQLSNENQRFSHHPIVETIKDGVQMGVLGDGTPYMALRGLARMCGIDHTALLRLANNWGTEIQKPRGGTIYGILLKLGHPGDLLFTRFIGRFGDTHAFPDAVCMAILEYYAFEAGRHCTIEAQDSFRFLARQSFKNFIYEQCGYSHNMLVADEWRQFHDRVSLNYSSTPIGYFSIFNAIADVFVTLGQNGLHTNDKFIPDISIGIAWSKYWCGIGGDTVYGERIRYPHEYPGYFPQALSNPQDAWAYPEISLGEFKRWFREHYVAKGALKRYLAGKAQQKALPPGFADSAVSALQYGHKSKRPDP